MPRYNSIRAYQIPFIRSRLQSQRGAVIILGLRGFSNKNPLNKPSHNQKNNNTYFYPQALSTVKNIILKGFVWPQFLLIAVKVNKIIVEGQYLLYI